jgi:Ca2+-binding RTX toxin-like protein
MRKINRGVIDTPIAPESSPLHDFANPGAALNAAPATEASSAKPSFALPPVNGAFLGGILTAFGNNNDNTIDFSRDAAGQILVNNGAAPVFGGTPTVANTKLIMAFGLGGDDTITINETNGALPRANLFGGAGNDILTGGSGADRLFGQTGNDTLLGKGGNDQLFGGAGNDVLTGGDADDQMFGQAGDDRMIWNPGDDNDLMEGGSGIDTAEINGGGADEVFTATANGARVRFDRVEPAAFFVDIGTSEKLVVNMGGGDDTFSATGDLASLISVTVDGGAGNDKILGSNGVDLLIGGEGNDFIDGQQGNDTALMGAGDDVFQWDPGDGSDVVEGQDGTDSMLFNGSGGGESFAATANGGRVLFTRNLGNIVMDLDDVESIDLNALAGTDMLTVNDLSGTDVTEVNVDLAGTIGGTVGDGEADTVTANSTNGDDVVDVVGAGTSVSVVGLAARINVTNSEVANDSLVINGLGGDDTITATTLPAGVVKLTIDGGAGDDTIFGSQAVDTLLGGDGDDFIFGDNGNDIAFMGAGDDVFQWDPGDGNDTVEGQGGFDTMLFLGAGAGETVDITANGGRVLFDRSPGNVVMDLNDVERIDFRALGGADNIVINDLSGTDVTQVDLDLRGPNGGGDGAADTVTAQGTNGDDIAIVIGDASGVSVLGLTAQVNVTGTEAANDRIVIQGFAGDDVIEASGVGAGVVGLTLDGGEGDDILIGGEGDDILLGGAGDDVLFGGGGNDIFDGGDGEDVELQGFVAGAGTDDQIDLSGRGLSFDWLMAHATDVNADTILDLGDQQITLRGVSSSTLHGDDFILS